MSKIIAFWNVNTGETSRERRKETLVDWCEWLKPDIVIFLEVGHTWYTSERAEIIGMLSKLGLEEESLVYTLDRKSNPSTKNLATFANVSVASRSVRPTNPNQKRMLTKTSLGNWSLYGVHANASKSGGLEAVKSATNLIQGRMYYESDHHGSDSESSGYTASERDLSESSAASEESELEQWSNPMIKRFGNMSMESPNSQKSDSPPQSPSTPRQIPPRIYPNSTPNRSSPISGSPPRSPSPPSPRKQSLHMSPQPPLFSTPDRASLNSSDLSQLETPTKRHHTIVGGDFNCGIIHAHLAIHPIGFDEVKLSFTQWNKVAGTTKVGDLNEKYPIKNNEILYQRVVPNASGVIDYLMCDVDTKRLITALPNCRDAHMWTEILREFDHCPVVYQIEDQE